MTRDEVLDRIDRISDWGWVDAVVTSSGTSVAAGSDDPKNGGSKPEER